MSPNNLAHLLRYEEGQALRCEPLDSEEVALLAAVKDSLKKLSEQDYLDGPQGWVGGAAPQGYALLKSDLWWFVEVTEGVLFVRVDGVAGTLHAAGWRYDPELEEDGEDPVFNLLMRGNYFQLGMEPEGAPLSAALNAAQAPGVALLDRLLAEHRRRMKDPQEEERWKERWPQSPWLQAEAFQHSAVDFLEEPLSDDAVVAARHADNAWYERKAKALGEESPYGRQAEIPTPPTRTAEESQEDERELARQIAAKLGLGSPAPEDPAAPEDSAAPEGQPDEAELARRFAELMASKGLSPDSPPAE